MVAGRVAGLRLYSIPVPKIDVPDLPRCYTFDRLCEMHRLGLWLRDPERCIWKPGRIDTILGRLWLREIPTRDGDFDEPEWDIRTCEDLTQLPVIVIDVEG